MSMVVAPAGGGTDAVGVPAGGETGVVGGTDGGGVGPVAAGVRGVRHCWQNLAPGRLAVPQLGQVTELIALHPLELS